MEVSWAELCEVECETRVRSKNEWWNRKGISGRTALLLARVSYFSTENVRKSYAEHVYITHERGQKSYVMLG